MPHANMSCSPRWTAAIGALCASAAFAAPEPFDWSLLNGQWAESAEHAYACRPDNVHFSFDVSPDRSGLRFKLDRPWPIAGKQLAEYSASIVEASGRMLVIRYGPELSDIPSDMREWELLFIGPGVYRWRATAWRSGSYNNVIGVRCRP
jgi:hypothetical protein